MSNSQLATLNTINESGLSADNIILPASATEGLKPIQVTVMKETVFTVNNNARLAGELLRSTAASLYELKQNLVNKQWMSFLKSGALPIPEKQARDLCAAWEGWLKDSDVTDGDLVSIGTRAMAKMKYLEQSDKAKVIKRLKAGEKVTEANVDDLRKRMTSLVTGVDKDNYESVTKDMKDINVTLVSNNNSFRSENNRMTDKIESLTAEVKKLEEMNRKYLDRINELEKAAV